MNTFTPNRFQQLLGIALIVGGLLVGIVLIYVMMLYAQEGLFTTAVASIGLLFGLILFAVPQLGIGAYILKISQDTKQASISAQQRHELVQYLSEHRQQSIPTLANTLNLTEPEVITAVYQAAENNELTGYINWDEGMLYCRQVTELYHQTQCPYCQNELQLARPGIHRCPSCNTEFFISE